MPNPTPMPMPGDRHPVYGVLGAVLLLSGERYYQFIDADGVVSMMPADSVDGRIWRREEPQR